MRPVSFCIEGEKSPCYENFILDLFNYIDESKGDTLAKVATTTKAMKESGELAEIIKALEKTVIDQCTK